MRRHLSMGGILAHRLAAPLVTRAAGGACAHWRGANLTAGPAAKSTIVSGRLRRATCASGTQRRDCATTSRRREEKEEEEEELPLRVSLWQLHAN